MDYELQQFYEIAIVAWNSEGFQVKKMIKVQLLDDKW